MSSFFTYDFYKHTQLCIQAVISSSVPSKTAISLMSSFPVVSTVLSTVLTPLKMIHVFSTAVFFLFSMSLILNCLYRRFHNLFSTQILSCQSEKDRASHLNEITGLSETNGFKFSGFCIEMEEVVHYPKDRTLCMWHCTRDAGRCHGHSAMNVSHHVKIKCAFNVWCPPTYICRQACAETLYILNICTYGENTHLWLYLSLCSIFNIFLFLPFQFHFNLPTWCHLVPQFFSCHKPLPFHLFLLPIQQCETHTHTQPTLLLLTAVCSETVKSQRCSVSGEPLVKRFYEVELMQLFFSGQ